jgi:hypothetical protein
VEFELVEITILASLCEWFFKNQPKKKTTHSGRLFAF